MDSFRFIVFNIPGAMFGAWTGSKMGKVRDMKGKCVYTAFEKLGGDKKRDILSNLAKGSAKGIFKYLF